MIRWRQEYEGGRIVAVSGKAEIGAVFPPCGSETAWRWTMWFGSRSPLGPSGKAKTATGAKSEIMAAFGDMLIRAGLQMRAE